MSYSVEYNGETEKQNGLVIIKRPELPLTERKYSAVLIPGKDGKLYEFDGTVEDIEIEIVMGFRCEPDLWMDRLRKARRWLLTKGNGKLIFSDDTDFFYKVKTAYIKKSKRPLKTLGEFTVIFVCEGYQYLLDGEEKHPTAEVLYNWYDLSHPTYIIAGEGTCILTVNGKTMEANVGQNLTINTDLMLSYRKDGTLQNTSISGEYEDLYLRPGDNTIEITDGFELSVIPNWRCL